MHTFIDFIRMLESYLFRNNCFYCDGIRIPTKEPKQDKLRKSLTACPFRHRIGNPLASNVLFLLASVLACLFGEHFSIMSPELTKAGFRNMTPRDTIGNSLSQPPGRSPKYFGNASAAPAQFVLDLT